MARDGRGLSQPQGVHIQRRRVRKALPQKRHQGLLEAGEQPVRRHEVWEGSVVFSGSRVRRAPKAGVGGG